MYTTKWLVIRGWDCSVVAITTSQWHPGIVGTRRTKLDGSCCSITVTKYYKNYNIIFFDLSTTRPYHGYWPFNPYSNWKLLVLWPRRGLAFIYWTFWVQLPPLHACGIHPQIHGTFNCKLLVHICPHRGFAFIYWNLELWAVYRPAQVEGRKSSGTPTYLERSTARYRFPSLQAGPSLGHIWDR